MHFQIKDDLFYPRIRAELFSRVPEFTTVFDESDDIYLVLGEFGRFILHHQGNDAVFKKCTDFLSVAILNGGHKTKDAMVSQVLEQVSDQPEAWQKLRKMIDPNALHFLDEHLPPPEIF